MIDSIKRWWSEVQEFRKVNDDLRKRISELQVVNSTLRGQVKKLEDDIKVKNSALKSTGETVKGKDKEIEKYAKVAQRIKSKLGTAEEDLEILTGEESKSKRIQRWTFHSKL